MPRSAHHSLASVDRAAVGLGIAAGVSGQSVSDGAPEVGEMLV